MTITACRIIKARHAATAFTGEGARRFGGRWSSPGIRVVYSAGSAALAMLESLVHLHSRELIHRFVRFEIAFDSDLVELVNPARLPRGWRNAPAPLSLREIGDDWVRRGDRPILRVPSVIVPTEWNYLQNPEHPKFRGAKIGPRRPLKFDSRLE